MDRKLKISFNSPIILGFVILSFIVYLTDNLTGGFSTRLLFSVYRSSFIDPFTYFRFFGHVLGHANLDHFLGNIMLILVIGPMLEEKYGSANILFVILATALVTGLVHFFVFPYVYLLGASGVVFAFILLSSFAGFREGRIPFTFIVVALLYIGQQVYQGVFVQDNISNLTHILGGIVGAVLGYIMNKGKMNRY